MFLAHEGEAAGEERLEEQEQHAGQPRDEQQEHGQHGQLAQHVLGAREGLRQVDLQGVGPPVVGDEPGADVDGDEEDEDALLVEELAERLGLHREHRGLREVGRHVDLHGPDDEGDPGEEEQGEEHALLHQRRDAGQRDDGPRAARALTLAAVAPVGLIVDGHGFTVAESSGEHVLEGRDARPQVAHLHLLLGGQREDVAWAEAVGHEHAHHVLVGRVRLEPVLVQHVEERGEIALDPQLEDAAGRPLSAWMGP